MMEHGTVAWMMVLVLTGLEFSDRDKVMKLNTRKLSWAAALIALCTSCWTIANSDLRTGTVSEVINVTNYTYLKIKEGDTTLWLATAPLEARAGDLVQFEGGMQMKAFQSEALGRNFDSILFIGRIEIFSPENVEHQAETSSDPVNEDSQTVTAPLSGEIERLDGGVDIKEILAESKRFEGQIVRFRAKVMKVTSQVMGKNWIVLADGSRADSPNTLLATSSESPKAGEIVIAEGMVLNDVSLGYGYDYDVLLEDTNFVLVDEIN